MKYKQLYLDVRQRSPAQDRGLDIEDVSVSGSGRTEQESDEQRGHFGLGETRQTLVLKY